MKTIAIDSGSSYMKALSANRRIMFPAVTYLLPEGEHHDSAIVVDGQNYVVGRIALAVGTQPVDPGKKEVGFHGSPEQYVQICHVLNEMEAEGDYDKLVVSLPYGDALDKNIIERVRKCKEFAWERDGKKVVVRFGCTQVMPQGVGALRRLQIEEVEPTDMLMVDVGSCTLDVVVLRWDGEKYHYHQASSGSSREVNAQAFKNHWQELLRRHDGAHELDPHYHNLMQHAMAGQWVKRFHALEIDTHPDYVRTQAWFTTKVKETVWKSVSAHVLADVGRIVLTGGGAELVDVSKWNDARVMKLNVWANAEGQYLSGAAIDPDEAQSVLEEAQ